MEEEILNKIAEFTKNYLIKEIREPRARYTYSGQYIGNYPVSASGRLANSIDYRVELNKDLGEYEVIFTMEDYGADILFAEGRRPGKWPGKYPSENPQNIRDWARIKINGFGSLSQREQEGLVFVISRAIKRRGIGPVDILGLATAEVEEQFENYFNQLVDSGEIETIPGLESVQDAINRIIFLSKGSDLEIQEL